MRLHLVDGTYELFRAHFSPRPSRITADGQDVKAVHGLVSTLRYLVSGEEAGPVTHLAVAFDNPIESFRNTAFPGYKNGDGVDPALLVQFDLAEELTAAMGIHVWSMADFEADDALASAATQFADDFDEIIIMTIDKDLAQCVTEDGHVTQRDRRHEVTYDADAVRAKHGVSPASIPDYLALVGDTADGIPGLKGFGKKSTSTLLAHYEHLEAVPDSADEWTVDVRGARSLAATLSAERPAAMLYRMLATLVLDVPLDTTVDQLQWAGPSPELPSRLASLGLDTLAERVASST